MGRAEAIDVAVEYADAQSGEISERPIELFGASGPLAEPHWWVKVHAAGAPPGASTYVAVSKLTTQVLRTVSIAD